MVDPTDPFNNLSGSVGVMGALDCAMVISKDKRNDKEATIAYHRSRHGKHGIKNPI